MQSSSLNGLEYSLMLARAQDEKAQARKKQTGYAPGDFVQTVRLRKAKQFNNELGYVCDFDEDSGRYVVHLVTTNPQRKIKIKTTNLLVNQQNIFKRVPDPLILVRNLLLSGKATVQVSFFFFQNRIFHDLKSFWKTSFFFPPFFCFFSPKPYFLRLKCFFWRICFFFPPPFFSKKKKTLDRKK